MKKNTPSDDEIKNYSHKKMTLPLMEHASEEMKEPVWKLVKKLASYARVPGAMSDFKKMAVFAEDDAIDSIKERVPIQVNKLYHDYTNADKIEAEYINVENPEDGKVFVEVDENGYVVRIVEKGKNIYTKIFKHYSYDMINYAIVRDVLLRKHMEEMRINDIADARVVEATRTDLKKLYSDIEISVNNKEFAYILDGHEKFNNT